jgi:hypothetical protein
MSEKYFSELNLKVKYRISILKSFLVKYLMETKIEKYFPKTKKFSCKIFNGNKNKKIFSKNKHGKSRKYFPVKYFIKKKTLKIIKISLCNFLSSLYLYIFLKKSREITNA